MAVITSIQTSIENRRGSEGSIGREGGFWFLFAVVCVQAVGVGLLRNTLPPVNRFKGTTGSRNSGRKLESNERNRSWIDV